MFAFVSKVLGRNRRSNASPVRRPARTRLCCEALEDRQLLSVTGVEVRVNTPMFGQSQYDSANARAANGRSVVVWKSLGSDNDTDIRAQIYDGAGNRVGGEIAVASSSKGEHRPAVAMDAQGNFVVVWTLVYSNTDLDVYAARFAADGTRRGGDIPVATSTREEDLASVAMAANGAFVVSYDYSYSDTDVDVHAKMYTAGGSLVRQIDVATSGLPESSSSVAMAPDGRLAIAYQMEYPSGDTDIHLARYTALGEPLGNLAMDLSSRHDTRPEVAMDNAGNAVVVYQALVYKPWLRQSDWDILARRVSSSGARGPERTITAQQPDETGPVVALDPTTGGFVVAYATRRDDDLSTSRVMVREVSASDRVSEPIELGYGPLSLFVRRFQPAISIAADHTYLVTYTRGDYEIFGMVGRLDLVAV